jgi:hypothetical protein
LATDQFRRLSYSKSPPLDGEGTPRQRSILSGRRDLAENLAFRFQPIIERIPVAIPTLGIELIGSLRDQDVQVIAG